MGEFQRRPAVVAWRGGMVRAWEDNKDGEVAAGLSCAARGGGVGQLAGENGGGGPKQLRAAAPLFGRERRRKKSSKGGFLIFQNFRGLTEKNKFPLI